MIVALAAEEKWKNTPWRENRNLGNDDVMLWGDIGIGRRNIIGDHIATVA